MRKLLCLVVLSFCLVIPGISQGAIFNVTNETELQDALVDASDSAEDDTINIAAGQYLTSNNGGNAFTYPPPASPAGSLTIQGAGMGITILDGGNSSPVMDIQDFESTGIMIIQDITFQNGNGNGVGGLGMNLGGNTSLDLTIQHCAIQDNTSIFTTAGVGVQNLGGFITFHNNLVTGNESTLIDGTGGAFFSMDTDPLIITNSIFFDNLGGRTGGISALSVGGNPLTLTNNTIVGNTSDQIVGTGGLELGLGENSTADIFNNIIFGNNAEINPDGNDIFNASGTPTVINLFNNDFSDFDNDTGATVNEGGNLNIVPELVNPAGGNFELESFSPVIDRGDPSAPEMPTTDFAGDPRPAIPGTNPDMGALEFQPPPPTPTPTPTPIPNISGSGCGLASAPFHWELGLLFLIPLALGFALRRSKS